MIVAADLHLKTESADTVFDEVLPGLTMAVSNDRDETLAILGDIWHVRYQVSVTLQNRLFDYFSHLGRLGIRVYLLPGNHDQINEAGENALRVFSPLSNVCVFSDPVVNDFGLWVPYRKDLGVIASILDRHSTCDTLWMHHGVQGALKNNSHMDADGLDPAMLSNSRMVITGHYHKRQEVGNVNYIGSPYQTRADEAGQTKGYAIWDQASKKLEYADTDWGRRYHRMEVDVDDFVIPQDVRPTDDLRLTVESQDKAEALGRKLLARGFNNFVITPRQAAASSRLVLEPNASLHDYARAYVETLKPDLDVKRLHAVYQGITEAV